MLLLEKTWIARGYQLLSPVQLGYEHNTYAHTHPHSGFKNEDCQQQLPPTPTQDEPSSTLVSFISGLRAGRLDPLASDGPPGTHRRPLSPSF